ncbi:MAG: gluconate 2-dehydrogenase subunit 3 family protein [Chitinophagaceae bacterium]|nr:gluconate 2-dehydrogenase subunit 3 family protein [Chitinophagaceae bacterium]
MNRRNALKNLAVASGSIISLPAWMVSCGISDSDTHHSGFNEKEQKILASLADTIIPAGNTTGALSVGVDRYLQKFVDDCCEKPAQDNVKKQLSALNNAAMQEEELDFWNCSQEQREKHLLKFAGSADNDQKEFFTLMKSETIRGFNTSQKVMEDFFGYKVAPGHYYGCVPA